MEGYDSKIDTTNHIERVGLLLDIVIADINGRKYRHDKSKLEEPEKSVFDEVTPKLKSLTYGSEEYNEQLKKMGTALEHHYTHNRHHPEHFINGIPDMNLIDIIEMLCDWKAASERHTNGNIYNSIEYNTKRFNISKQLIQIFNNTAKSMGW
jgi:hypothetical protein